MPRLTPEEMHRFLAARINVPLFLTITVNRVRLVSFRPQADGVWLRLGSQFLDADESVLAALAAWTARPAAGCPDAVRAFVRSCERPDPSPRRVVVRPKGRFHDLRPLRDRVNREHFGGVVSAAITWGRQPRAGRTRSRRLASYSRRRRLIAVNPRLDRPDTPPRLLEYLIYHEMLHALQPEDHRQPHDRAFREALHRHPDHEWAMAWEKANHDIIGIA